MWTVVDVEKTSDSSERRLYECTEPRCLVRVDVTGGCRKSSSGAFDQTDLSIDVWSAGWQPLFLHMCVPTDGCEARIAKFLDLIARMPSR